MNFFKWDQVQQARWLAQQLCSKIATIRDEHLNKHIYYTSIIKIANVNASIIQVAGLLLQKEKTDNSIHTAIKAGVRSIYNQFLQRY